jgi:hypothetical protein
MQSLRFYEHEAFKLVLSPSPQHPTV